MEAIWIGVDNPGTINTRMHLNRVQVKALLPILQQFVDTGDL